MNDTFVVIDGNSLINRGYYAIQRPMITKEGIYTQGIYAFLSMLSKIRSDYAPTHMLVAFDRKAPTFRHKEYDAYKAGRKGMPMELAMEMPILKEILDAMGIARYEIDGFEADDIIGTATKMAEEEGVRSYVITGDRDALQLATDLTSVIINKKGMTEFKLYDDAAMMEEYGFDHDQFIDYKALRGDSSDNIPGIPGVGDKTATALIKQFGSLENMIANLDQISNRKLRDKVEEGAMSAMMSKRLATIVRNVPMEMSFGDFAIREQDTDKLIDLYTKLEFKTYLAKLLKDMPSVTSPASSSDDGGMFNDYSYPDVKVVKDKDEALDLFSSFKDVFVLFGSDNNHISIPEAKELSVLSEGKVYVFETDDLSDLILRAFSGRKIKISGYNIGSLFYFLFASNADVKALTPAFDCSVAAYVLNPSSKERSLDELLLEYFHIAPIQQEKQMDLFGSAAENDYSDVQRTLSGLFELSLVQAKEITEAKLEKVFYDIEMPLVKVLASMEASGFRIDPSALSEFGKMLKEHISVLEKDIYALAGQEFNINSPKQLGTVLFEDLKLPAGKKTSKGYSTSAEILEKLAPEHEIVAKILEYRSYAKLNSTYVEGLLPLVAMDGKIHPHFQQTVTATGRISCTEPNLQNIPIRTELGRNLRKVFTASDEEHILIGADYSQIELRVMASMSGDKTLINAFKEGHDVHRETASKVFGVPLEEVTPLQRSNAKAVNFGVIYGMSQWGLSEELTISKKEAEKYISDYFKKFKDVKDFLDRCVSECKATGQIRTLYGRRRMVPEINASQFMVRQLGERLAMNTPVQGTAADIIKIAMNKVFERLSEEAPEAKLILQIHDELIIDAPVSLKEKVSNILVGSMTGAADLEVELEVQESSAYNWYDLK